MGTASADLGTAQVLNAKLPVANWFPLFITKQEMAWLNSAQEFQYKETGASLTGLLCHSLLSSPSTP